MLEYEEKLESIFSVSLAEKIISAFSLLSNVKKTEVHFRMSIIHTDMDDNKFVDCAFASNAHYLVTGDKHFNILKDLSFPSINVITLEEFKALLLTI